MNNNALVAAAVSGMLLASLSGCASSTYQMKRTDEPVAQQENKDNKGPNACRSSGGWCDEDASASVGDAHSCGGGTVACAGPMKCT